MSRREAIIQKIAKRLRVDPTTGCHLWIGPTSGKKGRGAGYGRMSLAGQTVAVHIVVYTHYNGYVPSRKQVDHKCRNRLCCNPDHLELVTPRQNQKRKSKPPCIAAKSILATKLPEPLEALPSTPTDATTAGSCGKKPCRRPACESTGHRKTRDQLEALLPKRAEL